MQTVTVLIPAYNDGPSLAQLIGRIDSLVVDGGCIVEIVIVNDGGEAVEAYVPSVLSHVQHVEVIELVVNLGHQRAIAVGLVELANREKRTPIIIMDSDGEDKPTDILRLLDMGQRYPGSVIVAQRRNRSESLLFRSFYRMYRAMFTMLTGEHLDFGNFMLLPPHVAKAIVYDANLWNHIAATILYSKYPVERVPTNRGARYEGRSTMNFESLVTHGLSAMSVYLTRIFTRMIVVLSSALGLAFVGIGIVIFIRLFTELAIPGWATNLVGILTIIILQLVLLLFGAIFATLNRRAIISEIPFFNVTKFIHERKVIF